MRWRPTVEMLLLVAIAAPAAADETIPALPADMLGRPPASPDVGTSMPLMLAVTLNQTPQPHLMAFTSRDGRLFASADVLHALGFVRTAATETGPVALDTIPGVQVRYDIHAQRVSIDAPLSQLSLATTHLGRDDPMRPLPDASTPGVLLNYDVYASESRGARQVSAGTELRAFGIGSGVLSNTAILRTWHERDPADDGRAGWRRESVRLDTAWTFSFPTSAVTMTIGDTLSGFLDWSRPVRLGGLQVGRNFGLQPYRVTTPLPAFLGEVAVPSSLELYVNGIRQYQGQVPVGPFELATLPGITGAGNAQVVIADAYGRTRTLDFPFYATQRLLARGLSDWSASVGRVREEYGIESFAYYDDTVASGNLRYGASDRLTVELHAEGGGGLRNAGVGAAWLLGMAGVVSASHVRSRFGPLAGSQSSVAYSWQPGRLNLSLDTQRTHGDYRDIASLYGPLPSSRTERALIGMTTARAGNFNFSYLRLDRPERDAAQARYAGAFWSRSFVGGWSANASINQNLDDRDDRSVYIGVLVPLGQSRQLSVSTQQQGEQRSALVDLARPVPGDGGFGWRVQARTGASGGGLAEFGWLGDHGRLSLGAAQLGDLRQHYAQADGGLVWMGGGLFPSRRVDDAFAVVTTNGYAGIPVTLENRTIGHTDARGRLLVTPLQAWQNNRLGIDPMALPASIRVDDVTLLATPRDRAGTTARFRMSPVRAALLVLEDAAGAPLPMGSHARLVGQDAAAPPAIVGYDGELYIEGLSDLNQLRISADAGDCMVRFTLPRDASRIPRLGPLRCAPVAPR